MSGYTGPERRHNDEVGELRNATERLAEQVATLSVALQTVGHLQRKQGGQAQEAIDLSTRAKEIAAQTTEDISISQGIERALSERRLRIFAVVTSVVALVVALAAVGVAFGLTHEALAGQARDRAALCMQGNRERTVESRETRTYFTPKLVQLKREAHPDPVILSIVTALANSKPQLLACPNGR